MRKLKLQIQITVDGFVAAPDGQLDWMTWNWDQQLKDFVTALTAPVGTILLGRKMTDGFITHWESVAETPDHPEVASGRKFVDTPKVVFTKTLQTSPWRNTVLAKGDLESEIAKLKAQDSEGDIIVYGGATLVASLIERGLIDELYLFVNPVAIAQGLRVFTQRTQLRHVTSTAYPCGIVVSKYRPAES
jgi:dihydrofolate reductase